MRLMVQPRSYVASEVFRVRPFRLAEEYLQCVHENSCLAVLDGEPGSGKTFAALTYALRHGISYLTMPERVVLDKIPVLFFKRLAVELCGDEPANLQDAIDRVYAWSLSNGRATLFLDEAQWLTSRVLDFFRRLHDLTGATVLFIGHQRELGRLLSRFPQVSSRVMFRFTMPALSLEDVHEMFGQEFSHEVIEMLFQLTAGNFRRLMRLVTYLRALPAVKKRSLRGLTVSDVQSVAQMFA